MQEKLKNYMVAREIKCNTNGKNYIIISMHECPIPLAGRETVLRALLVLVEPLLV